MIQNVKKEFIELALKYQALRFGEFKLKSGRISPYFFNAGLFNDGAALAVLGRLYAAAIKASGLSFDMVFGPAYKGIPLASATAIALSDQHHHDAPYCFNRKESKGHGEGGCLVGAPLEGKVLVVDDVITAGTAIREALTIIAREGAEVSAILVGLDRQEKGQGDVSAIQALYEQTQVPVISIIQLEDIIHYMKSVELDEAVHSSAFFDASTLTAIEHYRAQFGV